MCFIEYMAKKSIKIVMVLLLANALLYSNPGISHAKVLTINKHSPNLESVEKKAPRSSPKSKASTKKKSVKTKYQNGTLNDKIQIHEILPNPKGADGQKEWIKLFNPSDQNTNLGNWKIVQTATTINTGTANKASTSSPTNQTGTSSSTTQTGQTGSTKSQKFILPDTLSISPKSYLLISNRDLKFTLRNKNNLIELKNFSDQTVDSIKYEKAAENQKINKKTNHSELQKNSSSSAFKTSIHSRLNLYKNAKATMKQQTRTQNIETWLYFSIIPVCLLILLLHKTFRGSLDGLNLTPPSPPSHYK